MIPQFFTVTLWGGRATTRINAHQITRISSAAEGAVIYLAGGDPIRVNHSDEDVEAMIAALDQAKDADADIVTPAEVRAETTAPRPARKKAA